MSFSLSENEYKAMLARITALELHANDQAVAMDKFITGTQVNELSVLLQSMVSSLGEQVEALELRVVAIEQEPLT